MTRVFSLANPTGIKSKEKICMYNIVKINVIRQMNFIKNISLMW